MFIGYTKYPGYQDIWEQRHFKINRYPGDLYPETYRTRHLCCLWSDFQNLTSSCFRTNSNCMWCIEPYSMLSRYFSLACPNRLSQNRCKALLIKEEIILSLCTTLPKTFSFFHTLKWSLQSSAHFFFPFIFIFLGLLNGKDVFAFSVSSFIFSAWWKLGPPVYSPLLVHRQSSLTIPERRLSLTLASTLHSTEFCNGLLIK